MKSFGSEKNSYRPVRRRVMIGGMLAAALAATLLAVRQPLTALCRTHVALLFSDSRGRFATADERADWAARHPGELRVALVGRPEDPRLAAFESAVSAVNAAGGADGRRLVPVRVDPGTAPDGLQVALTRLASDPSAFALFAALSDDQLLSVKSILLQGRLITFAPGVTNRRATCPDEIPYVFMPNASDADIAADLADVVCRTANPGLVLCHDDTEAGRGLGEELQKAFQEHAMPRFVRIPLARAIEKTYVRKLVEQAHEFHGIDHVAYFSAGCLDNRTIVKWLLKTLPGKVILPRPIEGDWTNDEKGRFIVPGRMPDAAAVAAQSVWLFSDALRQAGKPHPAAVSDTLCTSEMKTPAGAFRFTSGRFERIRR